MAKFEAALQLVLNNEGGLETNSADSSGITNFGISLRFYRQRIKSDADASDIKNLTVNQAAQIYHDLFWSRIPFCEINSQKITNRLFDLSVNVGPSEAIKLIQKALAIPADGILGPKTLDAINSSDEDKLYCSLIEQAEIFYKDLVAKNPKEECFLQGWINRLKS